MPSPSKYTLQYSQAFIDDFKNIVQYIACILQNPQAADKFINNVEKAILKRLQNPDGYLPIRTRKPRKLIFYRIRVGNYIIIYTLIDDVMTIHRIIYARRDLDAQL